MPDTYTTRDLCHWYQRGIQDERERAAGAGFEAALMWERTAEQVSRDRHAELMRLFRRKAEEIAESMGRRYRPYHGGPLDWETGLPVTTNRRLKVAA